jgi:hypothetical protein
MFSSVPPCKLLHISSIKKIRLPSKLFPNDYSSYALIFEAILPECLPELQNKPQKILYNVLKKPG